MAEPQQYGTPLASRAADAVLTHPVAAVKPRLRGWLHAAMSPVVLVSGIVLVSLAPTTTSQRAAVVYSLAGVLLFVGSAVYNIGTWQSRGQAILRRLDHANVYLIIAGTYTPVATLTFDGAQQRAFIIGAWTAAALGVGFRVAWIQAPRALYTGLYIVMGWAIAPFIGEVFTTSAPAAVLILSGGVLYTIGAVVYGIKRPNPSPRWFGFHEVFHACTLGAWSCHYIAISILTYQAL